MTVAVGDPIQAQQFPEVWSPPPTSYTYQWQSTTNPDGVTGAANIGGATKSLYVVQAGDVGKYITYLVTPSNVAGAAAAARSAVVGPVIGGPLTGGWGAGR